jgi:hypothetical protein
MINSRNLTIRQRRAAAGQCLCIKEVNDVIWLVSFMHYDSVRGCRRFLRYILLPMSPGLELPRSHMQYYLCEPRPPGSMAAAIAGEMQRPLHPPLVDRGCGTVIILQKAANQLGAIA